MSRSAFYDHYRDVHELAEDACTAMIDDLIESLPGPALDSPDLVREATASLETFFGSLAGHAGLYRALLGPQGSARVAGHVRRRRAHGRGRGLARRRLPPPAGGDGRGDLAAAERVLPHQRKHGRMRAARSPLRAPQSVTATA
ncbi:hypothetical protein ACQEUU_04635 [Nonomuraea sp. CA-218870]|uniref:hypothetical protein n=1 Tax=Nonomuraea sp. CA-218870 TaxID=3239998 RepID=UPI003D94AC48